MKRGQIFKSDVNFDIGPSRFNLLERFDNGLYSKDISLIWPKLFS